MSIYKEQRYDSKSIFYKREISKVSVIQGGLSQLPEQLQEAGN
jgi:hypothetical protein